MSYNQDITETIQNMGYTLAIPKSTPTPSYYKLGDGTILSVLTKANYILTNALKSGSAAINHSTEIRVFTPQKNRQYKPIQSNQPPAIIDQDVKCTPIKEEFNDYAVGKHITISIKAVVGQVVKMDAYNNEGEPIYSVDIQPVVKVVDRRHQSSASGIF